MSTPKTAIAVPLAVASEPAGRVLDRMDRQGASAVLLDSGFGDVAYRVHRIEQLRAAHEDDPAAIAGHAKGGTDVTRLPTKDASDMGLDFSNLKPSWVEQAFRTMDHPGVVAAIAPTAAGPRMATLLLNPLLHETDQRALTFLGYAYRCKVDKRIYSAPGKCPVHRVELQRVEIDP